MTGLCSKASISRGDVVTGLSGPGALALVGAGGTRCARGFDTSCAWQLGADALVITTGAGGLRATQ